MWAEAAGRPASPVDPGPRSLASFGIESRSHGAGRGGKCSGIVIRFRAPERRHFALPIRSLRNSPHTQRETRESGVSKLPATGEHGRREMDISAVAAEEATGRLKEAGPGARGGALAPAPGCCGGRGSRQGTAKPTCRILLGLSADSHLPAPSRPAR